MSQPSPPASLPTGLDLEDILARIALQRAESKNSSSGRAN